MSIVIHHLNKSRSQRIVWLLEELGLSYRVQHYQRDLTTNLAPPALKKIHPLGKSPLLEDDGILIQESGAIVQYLCERYGQGRFLPLAGSQDALRHLQLMHFAEGSAMTPILLRLYVARLGEAAQPLHPRINEQLIAHFDYLENELQASGHFVGDDWTGADVMLSFPATLATLQPEAERWPRLRDFIQRIQSREAWKRAVQATGELPG
ncbi:glutathione S-transferase family protein [Uliginosibacterium aquaticum]|uniref:Glutathione S-transferase n=1 Tax=Uliginosibacterium aquaticum TaxID=2731212 RepID=A0ABX2IE66_9RHOO|nr:glutathione S-transferase [Uliginosibacterium aquaticum]NSL54931.1 glutathione S-transferase [Uliginosibacterium aquaticum]